MTGSRNLIITVFAALSIIAIVSAWAGGRADAAGAAHVLFGALTLFCFISLLVPGVFLSQTMAADMFASMAGGVVAGLCSALYFSPEASVPDTLLSGVGGSILSLAAYWIWQAEYWFRERMVRRYLRKR